MLQAACHIFFVFTVVSCGYNSLPEVDRDVLRRILVHADPKDLDELYINIKNCNDTEVRKDMVESFVGTKFGIKKSRTVSPFDDQTFVLHKMWSLLDQRQAMVAFFDEADRQMKSTITMGLASELFELFYILDRKYCHLFPAASMAWSESIAITLSYVGIVRPQAIVEGTLININPDAAFHLLYWQLYDSNIETNVLFLPGDY